jgi:NADH-quinone oxidoreductase subunit J
METTPELVIFLIVGAVAVLAAVMMLISENAVHSALFLILNFACVAFFFLMLDAAFLAMVQVAVYAGAIMVLFMFVIMLLGAERLAPDPEPRFPWLTPVAVVLTLIFLITASLGILEAEISSNDPEAHAPLVRVINVVPELESVDVTLNGEAIAEDVTFNAASELVEWPTGDYEIAAVGHLMGGQQEAIDLSVLTRTNPMADADIVEQVDAALESGPPSSTLELSAPELSLAGNEAFTLVIAPLPDGGIGVIPVSQDLNTVDDRSTANVQFVHANPSAEAVDLAEITQPDEAPHLIFENIAFGGVSDIRLQRDGQLDFGLYAAGTIREEAATNDDLDVKDVEDIGIAETEEFNPNSSTLFVLSTPLGSGFAGQGPTFVSYNVENRASFGGPTSVGRLLFTTYMLPFQVIALLLLVAMIGAIVLTRDQVPPPKKRHPRRLANVPPPAQESSQD